MGQTRRRATKVAENAWPVSQGDLAEGLSLDLINRNFPGMTRRAFARPRDCKDEATLEYERAQEMLMSVRRRRRDMPPVRAH